MKLLLDENLSPRLPALILQLLRVSRDEIEAFVSMPDAALLILSARPSQDANQ